MSISYRFGLLGVTFAVLCLCGATPANCASLYSIGNSLTNDMWSDGLQTLSQDAGLTLVADYHIRGSGSMTYMVNNPTDVTLARPAAWNIALQTGTYDFVTVEPYNGLGAPTNASETDAIATVVESALAGPSKKAIFFLYSAWPNRDETGGNYQQYWSQKTTVVATQSPLQTRDYYDQLLAALQARFGDRATFRVIPIGDVFARIDQDARAGLIPGIDSMESLYRDQTHMGEVGRFVAASTVFATLFHRRSGASSALDAYQFNDGAAQLTPELAAKLENIVWSVVSTDARTGVSSSSTDASNAAPTTGGSGSIDLSLIAVLGLGRLLTGWHRYTASRKSDDAGQVEWHG